VRTIKLWWLIAAFLSGVAAAMWAEELILRTQENRLEFSAPQVHFLTGRPLERLRNAASVPFDFQVTLAAGSQTRIVRRTQTTFVISYDILEERYSVNKVAPRKAAGHLTESEAEAWCLQEMAVDVNGLSATEPLWARMDIRARDERNATLFGRDSISDNGINLNGLIELFSRPPQATQPHWLLEAGPVTLEQLRAQVRRGRV
jgi:hypothetical protein